MTKTKLSANPTTFEPFAHSFHGSSMPTIAKHRGSKAPKRRSVTPPIYLPKEMNSPPEHLADSVGMIYGRKGIGKTSLASRIRRDDRKSLTLMLERGRRNLRIHQVSPNDYDELLQYVSLFVDDDAWGSVVVDTVDVLRDFCVRKVCKELGVSSPQKIRDSRERAGVWGEIGSEFGGFLGMMVDCGKGLTLVSHESTRELENRKIKQIKEGIINRKAEDFDEDEETDGLEETPQNAKIERIQPSCTDATFREVEQICNFVFYYGFVGRQRTITVRDPSECVWCSSGDDEHFLQPNGEPLQTFAVANNADQAYKDVLLAFDNQKWDVNYMPPRNPGKRVSLGSGKDRETPAKKRKKATS